jgi:hypothetical protein
MTCNFELTQREIVQKMSLISQDGAIDFWWKLCKVTHFKYKVSCKIKIMFLTKHGLSRYLIFDFILKFPSPHYLL